MREERGVRLTETETETERERERETERARARQSTVPAKHDLGRSRAH
jgi:hypothetical protein